MKKYVAYYRVSTAGQGQSGLGLSAQQTMVLDYLSKTDNGGLIAEFIEIESGTSKGKRTEIFKAIEFAKSNDAVLLIAKLDRLARNVHFISGLMSSGVEFICCDMPTATHFTIHIYSAIAEMEAKMISERTRQALAEKKKQGVRLGTPENLKDEHRRRAVEIRKENARLNKNNKQATALIIEYRSRGLSFHKIADRLNELQMLTVNGRKYCSRAVHRLYQRHLSDHILIA